MPRPTMTSTAAAAYLGCTRQNVHDLFRRGRLEGPPHALREPLLLWEDSVHARRSVKGPLTDKVDLALSPGELAVATALRTIDRRLERLEVFYDGLATATSAQMSVQDELEDALQNADNAISLLTQALAAAQRSKEAHARASRIRAEALRQGLMPPGPPESHLQ